MAGQIAAVAALLLPLVAAITPEQMLSAPRYSTASANPSGEWAVYTSTNYSFAEGASSTTWKLLNINTGDISDLPFDSDVSEIVWVGSTNTSVLYLNGTNDDVPGGVTLWTTDLAESPIVGIQVASLAAPFSGLKASTTSSGGINFVVNAKAYANNGSAYNEELASTPASSGRLYDNVWVRHWDSYVTQERYSVFAGSLTKGNSSVSLTGNLTNLLLGIDAPITRPEVPYQPFGGSEDYDLSPDGSQVVFQLKAPELPKANFTASYIYVVPHDGSSVAKKLNGPGSKAPEEAKGASAVPVWSPTGKRIAYNQMDGIDYESDRAKLYIADVETGDITLLAGDWDQSASSIAWSHDCSELYVSGDYIGSTRLFIVPTDAAADYKPENITDVTSVAGFSVLPNGDALVSSSAHWSSRNIYTVTPEGETNYLYKANEVDAELAGLGPEDTTWFWYEGSTGDQQQAFVVLPEDFDENKVYDLAFLVHGGPQGLWANSWSTRWNPKVWADQGYVVVLPNPTGSTSYGQELTDRIASNWESYPYEDLVNAFNYVKENLPYANTSNAIEAGASYGGYMTNWIQGHDLGREFKALVCHDGVTTTYADFGTEELFFMLHEHNGTIWDQREVYAKSDPLTHAKNFSTPQLVIHNDLDYRLPVSEGIAMFNALQILGVPSRFLNFPDENHWVVNRENSLLWHKTVFDWINYYTGKVDTLEGDVITQ
jgi:dipeptidyl aminopeptidase/acylaminoacyl peptidase